MLNPSHSSFSKWQLQSLDIAARVSSCLSLSGAAFTLTSYICYAPLRKPFNRLAFLIAIANAFGCLAYSWGVHPVSSGRGSGFCQTQAFLIQWFVMTDPIIVLTMATSVWLRIKGRMSVEEIKHFENIGVCLAFTLPSIPAVVFLCWRPNGLTVYGPAGMWCWISNESNILRLASFCGPIWAIIFCSLLLFAFSGRRILHVRTRVRQCQAEFPSDPEPTPRKSSILVPTFSHLSWTKTGMSNETYTSSNHADILDVARNDTNSPAMDVSLVKDQAPSEPAIALSRANTAGSSRPVTARLSNDSAPLYAAQAVNRRSTRWETVHWKYARFAFLCTIVLFITWIPISINRVYNNFINTNHPIYGLYFASALCIPLHGFGNFIIYVNTSWAECQAWIRSLTSRSGKRRSSIPPEV